MEILELLPTPQTVDAGKPRPLRLKKDCKRDPTKKGSWRGDLKDHLFSQGAFLVSRSPRLDEEKERKTIAISGRRCYELYENFIRGGSSVKMLVASLLGQTDWFSNKCILTWKVKVTKYKRLLFQLAPSTRHTDETESGLLPTTQAMDWKGGTGYKGKDIPKMMAMLKTPSASESVGGWKVADRYWEANAPKLKMRDQVGRITGLKLQPAFALWMMGYPTDWLDLEDGEMPRSRVREMLSFHK